jgi:opacity protein-like surface antigen
MRMSRLSLATVTLATTACLSVPACAADLYGGSIKDAPVVMTSPHHCYLRGDVGYSWSRDPDAKFTQTDLGGLFVTDAASATMDNSWLAGVGVGCGTGSRGIRGELMVDWHGDRDIAAALATPLGGIGHTSVQTTTLMFNGYYDLGSYRGLVPYVGAGVGLAYNRMEDVAFTGNALANVIGGDNRWSLAWSLMAGVGYQVSDRATLDFGYRYIDMGKAESGIIDNTGATNPKMRIDDLAAHEFKVGLRFAFGGGEPCCGGMK